MGNEEKKDGVDLEDQSHRGASEPYICNIHMIYGNVKDEGTIYVSLT